MADPNVVFQQCINPDCAATYDLGQTLYACTRCGQLLDIRYDWARLAVPKKLSDFQARWASRGNPLDRSGVWRFRELLPFFGSADPVTIGEGQTTLQQADELAAFIGVKPGRLFLQYEGFNPSGSFKDNGMAAAFTHARMFGARQVACASTGNTSASLALYAARCGMRAWVFIGAGRIAFGKLSQALEYGAKTLQIDGDFDACMARVQEATKRLGLYLVNSVNPFRLEGQKAIMYRVLESLSWQTPDWIVVPGGNLGNSSAFGKAFLELKNLGLIDRIPRIAIINAAGANTLYRLVEQEGLRWNGGRVDAAKIDAFFARMKAENRKASTIASAIEINVPVNLRKALRALDASNGLVREVPDEAIRDAKAAVGKFGYGCEPASAASVAGLRRLLAEGVISPGERVVCILTGHLLKDPTATVDYHVKMDRELSNKPIAVADDIEAIVAAISGSEAPNSEFGIRNSE
ncbi:MAG: threonine synthase [Phycisphaerae bacterium]|nr:threonine synthase [Phycisphaerae bacterium]